MPLLQYSSSIANKNLRSNRACLWPDGRKSSERLDGLVKVSLNPGFNFSKSDKIFTIGSCFAREIEKYVSELGFDVPALNINIPAEERVSKTANDILNKYSVHSMENELQWAFHGNDIPPCDFYLNAGNGLWHDAQMVPNLVPASLDRVIERRQMVMDLMRDIPNCRIVVITLGLAEAWFDKKSQIYLNGIPPKFAIDQEPDRFVLNIITYEEILESLERIHKILSEHGHPDFKMLITVSPVPFKSTFSGKDALIANTYSKSVQRAAAEFFTSQHNNVDYFPSYEIVTLTERKYAYELDNIHVTFNTVGHIMTTVIKYYCPDLILPDAKKHEATVARTRTEPASQKTLNARGKTALSSKDYPAAVSAFSELLFRFVEKMVPDEEFEARLNLGVAMLRATLTKEGVAQLVLAKELVPGHPRATYKLGLGYARVKMHDKALEMFKEACRLNPNERDYHWRLGVQLIRMGRVSEGIPCIKAALSIDPEHQDSLEILAKYDI
ncbi:MAG: GSCFA domain-containing protein [Methylomonas sp.]|nr:GSCFA domain-containing protein [Methylomonas sp.]